MTGRAAAFCAALGVAAGLPASARQPATADVLVLGIDARSLALGEAYTAQARAEVGSLPRSPLGLTGLEEGAMAFSRAFLVEGMSANHFAYGRKLGRWSAGLSVVYLDYGSIEERDYAGAVTGEFRPRDLVYQASLARSWDAWEAGVSVKRLESKIVKSAGAFAVDAAARRSIGEGVSAALVVRNLGQKLKFETDAFDLPAEAAAGLSWVAHPNLHWNAEAVFPLRADLWVATGAQFDVRVSKSLSFAVRAGANTRTPELGKLAGLHGGFGVEAGPLGIDYSFDPFGDIGIAHNLGVKYRW